MRVTHFLGTRDAKQQRGHIGREEQDQSRTVPDEEREEIRQIFAKKGFSGADLERVVEVITSDDERWVSVMMREEHGYPAAEVSPWRAGLVTYSGFMVAGLLPLLPFIYAAIAPGGLSHAFFWSMGLAGGVFFTIGALKSLFVEQPWYWAGLEILGIGGVAAGLAYAVGAVLKGIADMV